MAFLIGRIHQVRNGFWPSSYDDPPFISEILQLSPDEWDWLTGLQTKVVLQAANLEELHEVERLVREAGLETQVITDAGLTEFKEPTVTALAIGPADAAMIDAITGPQGLHPLKLY